MKSAVTFSAVEQARGGPFVLWDSFPNACQLAARMGFDGIEVFAPAAEYFRDPTILTSLNSNGLKLAAVGTGAGWVMHKWTLSHPDSNQRQRAIDFVRQIIDSVADLHTQVIIGSMQGKAERNEDVISYRGWLQDSLQILSEYASNHNTGLLIEPLNRYETNLVTSVDTAVQLAKYVGGNLKLLCDIFHMNIEERCISSALEFCGPMLGHVHFADSNRHAVGFGHVDYTPLIASLKKIEYNGYLSAEVLPIPDSETAANQTQFAFQTLIGPAGRSH